MTTESGWSPLREPRRLRWRTIGGTSPFARLGLTHGLSMAGDTLVTMALAGSIFFSLKPGEARGKVILYLVLTMAPFAVLAPLLGPFLDRIPGRRRTMIVACAAARAVVCLEMARHLHSLLLFPEAFAALILSKAYFVTKSALVPSVVSGPGELVEANSRLAVIAVAAGFVAAGPGAAVLKIGFLGAPWVLRLAVVVFVATALAGLRLAKPPRAPAIGRADERAALRVPSVMLGASAMGLLRAIVGFLTFLVAFALRAGHHKAPSWWFGIILAVSLAGTFVGAVVAPRLREWVVEERILIGTLVLVAAVGIVASRYGNRPAVAALAAAVGFAASAGKLAFDSIVQRDAPDAARGRAFARYETRFQLMWVAGGLVPVVVTPLSRHLEWGMIVVAAAAAFAVFSYAGGRVAGRRHEG